MSVYSLSASEFYVCETVQNSDVDATEYAALTWVEVGNIGSIGQMGKETNVLTYPTLNTAVIQKAKGMTDAGSPEIEVARSTTDAGQTILRAAGAVSDVDAYAFKLVYQDGTIVYNRGLVLGPRRPNGRNEDFDLEVYTLALVQEEIVVEP